MMVTLYIGKGELVSCVRLKSSRRQSTGIFKTNWFQYKKEKLPICRVRTVRTRVDFIVRALCSFPCFATAMQYDVG